MPTDATSRAPSLPFPQRTTFGPGSLEDLVLSSWVDRHHTRWVRLQGTYQVYCGMGNEHTVTIATREHLSLVIRNLDYNHEASPTDELAANVAQDLLDGVLDRWSDPCDDDASSM